MRSVNGLFSHAEEGEQEQNELLVIKSSTQNQLGQREDENNSTKQQKPTAESRALSRLGVCDFDRALEVVFQASSNGRNCQAPV